MRRLLLVPALILLVGCDEASEMIGDWRHSNTVYAVARCIEQNKLVRDVRLNFDVQAECVRRHSRNFSFSTLGRSTGGVEGCTAEVEGSRLFGATVRNDATAENVLTSGWVVLVVHEGNRRFVSATERVWVPPGGQQEVMFRFAQAVPCAATRNGGNPTQWQWEMVGFTGVAATLR